MTIFYLLLLLLGLLIPSLMIIYVLYSILAYFWGAPYVATSSKIIKEILDKAHLKKGQIFIELGSGDGRITRTAVKLFKVHGLGIEIHPLLVIYSNLVSKLQHLKDISFKTQSFYHTDLKKADVLFLFLLPKTLEKLREKILKECQEGTLIISHGFKIKGMDKYLVDKIDRDLFPTYYYKL